MRRTMNIVAVSMAWKSRRPESPADNFGYLEETLAETAAVEPDVVVLPEAFPFVGLNDCEWTPDLGISWLKDMAAQHEIYLIGSLYEEREDGLYHTAPLVGPQGNVVGRYDKVHLTQVELEAGLVSGRKGQAPIETQFGKVGVQICFDVNWPTESMRLVDEGAEIIFFPSAFAAGRLLNSIALLNEVHVVPAIWSIHGGVIDDVGRWLVRNDRFSWWVFATVNLDRTIFHWDCQGEKIPDIRAKYGAKVRIETYGDEARFSLEPLSEDVSIAQIIEEFELVTCREYLQQAEEARRASIQR